MKIFLTGSLRPAETFPARSKMKKAGDTPQKTTRHFEDLYGYISRDAFPGTAQLEVRMKPVAA
jgi:hypothetical protein